MTDHRYPTALLAPIRHDLECVEQILKDRLSEPDRPLRSMLQHVLTGGKRLRPALVILTSKLFGPCTTSVHKLAAAVEMLHTATLIHDDLLDDAPIRRGKKTLHTLWPMRETILAGDYLLAQAAVLIAELEDPAILEVFAKTLCTICAGEIRQTLREEERTTDRTTYFTRIAAKTASLFSASAEMVGLLAETQGLQIVALRDFGHNLGMAFQIVDDVLDFTGDETQLGKRRGRDLYQGTITLPTLCYLYLYMSGEDQ